MKFPKTFDNVDVLSHTASATIDVGLLDNKRKKEFEHFLQTKGFRITKENKEIWTITHTSK